MKIIKSTDKRLEELGFIKKEENNYLVHYEKANILNKLKPNDKLGIVPSEIEEVTYIQVVDIVHKKNKNCIVQSYDPNLFDQKKIGNTCVGLTYEEMKLFMKKIKEKGWY